MDLTVRVRTGSWTFDPDRVSYSGLRDTTREPMGPVEGKSGPTVVTAGQTRRWRLSYGMPAAGPDGDLMFALADQSGRVFGHWRDARQPRRPACAARPRTVTAALPRPPSRWRNGAFLVCAGGGSPVPARLPAGPSGGVVCSAGDVVAGGEAGFGFAAWSTATGRCRPSCPGRVFRRHPVSNGATGVVAVSVPGRAHLHGSARATTVSWPVVVSALSARGRQDLPV
jgi:hypothetical protein